MRRVGASGVDSRRPSASGTRTRTASGASSWLRLGAPACRDADYVWAAKDELDGSVLHAAEATRVSYAPAVLTRRASDGSDLEVVALRVLRREVELDQGHPQMVLELLEGLRRAVLLPPPFRVEGLEELRVDLI